MVQDYIDTFGDIPEELVEWLSKADWLTHSSRAAISGTRTEMGSRPEPLQGSVAAMEDMDPRASSDEEDSGEEVSVLWVMINLGDVEEGDDGADAWSEEGRM